VVFLERALGGVDVPLAGGVVGVEAVLTRAAAGEVLTVMDTPSLVTPSGLPWMPGISRSKIFSISSGSSPKVPKVRCQRGSLTQSAMYI